MNYINSQDTNLFAVAHPICQILVPLKFLRV